MKFYNFSQHSKYYSNMIKFKTNLNVLILFLTIVLIFCSCSSTEKKINLKKVDGSPAYENSSLSIKEITQNEENFTFSFNVNNYELGIQTVNEFDYDLANSSKGQHIHFIVNNGPYSAHYNEKFKTETFDDNSIILAFLSRSHHESVKNPNAYILTQLGEDSNISLENEFLFYSRPKGTYKGADTEKLLLDFYLVNTDLSAVGNKVRITITQNQQANKFLIDQWEPYYIEGLEKGEVFITLELINNDGELIETPFNPSSRKVFLE